MTTPKEIYMDALTEFLTQYRLYFAVGAIVAGVVWGWLRLRKSAHPTAMRQSSGAHSTNIQAGRDINVPAKGRK